MQAEFVEQRHILTKVAAIVWCRERVENGDHAVNGLIPMSHHDQLLRFNFQHLDIRGELVYLNSSWQQILARYDYPANVRQQLGNAMAAVVLLSATIKFEGNMIMQVQGNGPLKKLVVQVTSEGAVRGLARWEGLVPEGSLQEVFGDGRIVITVLSQGADPYQSVVALEGHTLADALNVYFLQSEQLPSTFQMVTTPDCVAGFFLQQLPDSRSALERQMNEQAREEDWNRINVLAATVDSGELLGLQPETLLFRLFHEEPLLLHAPKDLHFSCTCSREKVERTLLTIGRAEADDILRTDGRIEVDCEFCQERYLFNAADVEALFDTAGKGELPTGSIVH